MKNEEQELQMGLRYVVEQTRQDAGPHLSPSTLESYHLDSMPVGEVEATRHHLVCCPACSDLLLDIAAYLDDRSDRPAYDEEAEIKRLLAGVRTSLHETAVSRPVSTPDAKPSLGERFAGLFRMVSPAYALVALLLAVSVGLALEIVSLRWEPSQMVTAGTGEHTVSAPSAPVADAERDSARSEFQETQRKLDAERKRNEQLIAENDQLRRRNETLDRPAPNLVYVELDELAQRNGSVPGDEETLVSVGKGRRTGGIMFDLNAPHSEKYDEYAAVIVSDNRKGRLDIPGLEPDQKGRFTFDVPTSRLPDGKYTVELVALRDGARTQIGQWKLRVIRE